MEPSWLLLWIGKDGKQMQKSKRDDSYQSSWYKTRAVYAAMHSQTQKKRALHVLALPGLSWRLFQAFLMAFEGLFFHPVLAGGNRCLNGGGLPLEDVAIHETNSVVVWVYPGVMPVQVGENELDGILHEFWYVHHQGYLDTLDI